MGKSRAKESSSTNINTDFNSLFQIFKQNLYPEMVELLAEQLGVSIEALNRLEVGFDPGSQAWVTPEFDDQGQIVGLQRRYRDGHKMMVEGSKRGLVFECVGAIEKTGYQKRSNFVRCYDAGVDCPKCGKRKWCMIAGQDLNDPDAVICGHTEKGAVKYIENSGYLHILKEDHSKVSQVLPHSEFPYLVVEGFSDTAAAIDFGRTAVGKPNDLGGSSYLCSLLKGKDVIVCGENDSATRPNGQVYYPGREGMVKTFNILRPVCASVRKVLPPAKSKDLRAWSPTADVFDQWVAEKADTADKTKMLERVYPLELAEKFLDNIYNGHKQPTLRYFLKNWYAFNKSHYTKLDDIKLDGQLYDFFKPFEVVHSAGKKQICEPIKVDKRLIADIVHAIRPPCLTIRPGQAYEGFSLSGKLKHDLKWAVPFKNGIYYVRRNEFSPPDPDIFILSTLPYNFDPIPCRSR